MSTQHLTLVGHINWQESYGIRTQWVQIPMSDGDLHVAATIPMVPLGHTNVALVPMATLSGTTISLDLAKWDLFDLEGGRQVGISFTASDPAAPWFRDLAARYVREARHLDSAALSEWVTARIAELRT
jgi:hypothetical protein